MADTDTNTPAPQTTEPQLTPEAAARQDLDMEFSRQNIRSLIAEIDLNNSVTDVGGRVVDHDRQGIEAALKLPEDQQSAAVDRMQGPTDALGSVLDDAQGDNDDINAERKALKEDYERLMAENPGGAPVDDLRDLVDRARELADRAEETKQDYAPRLEELSQSLVIEGVPDDATTTQSGHGAESHSDDQGNSGQPAGAELAQHLDQPPVSHDYIAAAPAADPASHADAGAGAEATA